MGTDQGGMVTAVSKVALDIVTVADLTMLLAVVVMDGKEMEVAVAEVKLALVSAGADLIETEMRAWVEEAERNGKIVMLAVADATGWTHLLLR